MSDPDNTMTLWAIDVLRRYAPDPLCDEQEYQAERMRQESERDAEAFFLDQQCPADSNFR
jgi:hypothetical protein